LRENSKEKCFMKRDVVISFREKDRRPQQIQEVNFSAFSNGTD
jgi:hypothetical protein